MKHTPGPWQTSRNGLRVITSEDRSNGVLFVADCYSGTSEDMQEDMANARLIAAAPKLLDVLESIQEITNEEHFIRSADSKLQEIRSYCRMALKPFEENK